MTPEEIKENKVVQICYDHLDKFIDIYPKDQNWENKMPAQVKITNNVSGEKEAAALLKLIHWTNQRYA